MLTTWRVFDHGLDRTFSLFDELRRAMDGVDAPQARDASLRQAWGWPQFSLEDTGDAVLVTADVPGMSPADVDLTLDDGVLTVSGERKVTPPEGFEPQSLERRAIRLSRSFSLPAEVRRRLARLSGQRVTQEGMLVIDARRYRNTPGQDW